MIAIERKRTERSKAPFVLMLLEAAGERGPKKSATTLKRVANALLSASRDTDLVGWYKDDAIVGTMFTGLIVNDKRAVLDTFLAKVSAALQEELTADEFNKVRISFHLFPDDWDHEKPGPPTNAALYPDLASRDKGQRTVLFIKRTVDFVGSSVMLILWLRFSWPSLSLSNCLPAGQCFIASKGLAGTARLSRSSSSAPCLSTMTAMCIRILSRD